MECRKENIDLSGNGLSKCDHFSLKSVHFNGNVRISKVFIDNPQSPIPKILTDLSENQLFYSFQSKIFTFRIEPHAFQPFQFEMRAFK